MSNAATKRGIDELDAVRILMARLAGDGRCARSAMFTLGSKVSLVVPTTFRPSAGDFKSAALKLGINTAMARKSWHEFTYGGN